MFPFSNYNGKVKLQLSIGQSTHCHKTQQEQRKKRNSAIALCWRTKFSEKFDKKK